MRREGKRRIQHRSLSDEGGGEGAASGGGGSDSDGSLVVVVEAVVVRGEAACRPGPLWDNSGVGGPWGGPRRV